MAGRKSSLVRAMSPTIRSLTKNLWQVLRQSDARTTTSYGSRSGASTGSTLCRIAQWRAVSVIFAIGWRGRRESGPNVRWNLPGEGFSIDEDFRGVRYEIQERIDKVWIAESRALVALDRRLTACMGMNCHRGISTPGLLIDDGSP